MSKKQKTPIYFKNLFTLVPIIMKKSTSYRNIGISKSQENSDLMTFTVLFEKHYSFLCNYVLRLSNDPDLAEDIVQSCFVKLWNRRKKVEHDKRLKSYLVKICHNEFLQHIKKTKKEKTVLYELRSEIIYEQYNEDEISKNKKIEQLREVIDELPPRCKEIFIYSKFEKLKYAEIAEKMGISKKTVEIQISKAFSVLRKRLHYLKIFF